MKSKIEQKLDQALLPLAEEGLNIFSCARLEEISEDLQLAVKSLSVAPKNTLRYRSIGVLAAGGTQFWSRLKGPVRADDHPVDNKSRQLLKDFHENLFPQEEFLVIYPDPQFLFPLQLLGRDLNISRPSFMGIDIHEKYGLWFSFRVVFLSTAELPRRIFSAFESPCLACKDQPCVNVCPVKAGGPTFKISVCADYRLSQDSPCVDHCAARKACPIGREHQFSLDQIQYSMQLSADQRKD